MLANSSVEMIERGAENLLLNCARARPGQRVLLVGEDGPRTYFQPALCNDVARIATRLGMVPEIVVAAPVADAEHFPDTVWQAMQRADCVIFFSRLGDQVRFSLDGARNRAVMTYTLNQSYLGAPFATTDFKTMKKMHDALLELILEADTYRIQAACGTDLTGPVGRECDRAVADFALELFPVMIFPPILSNGMEGTLVIDHFVTSSSTRAYENSTLILDGPIRATVEAAQMTEFDGPRDLVAGLVSHLERAAALTGGDPMRINSWHTGINPGTFFEGNPYDDLEFWGTVAYGSPRFTHFHASGIDPGDAAFSLMDATIRFDDEVVWQDGRFVFLDRSDIQAIIGADQRALLNASVRHSIGL